MLASRIERFGGARDPIDIWRLMGFIKPQSLPLMEAAEFVATAAAVREGGA